MFSSKDFLNKQKKNKKKTNNEDVYDEYCLGREKKCGQLEGGGASLTDIK